MMRQYLISSVFSLSLISLAQAAELTIEQQCQALGYNTKISDCERAGSAALVCPLNDQTTNMALCITDSCRGYPLYQKNGKFYYQDQSGNEVEAVPSKGQLADHMEGSFETCTAGYGANAVTYYRVPKCKGEALYNNYFCDVGCDTEKKYPYTYHPGNTAGTVQKCVTADQTYYGYSSCNKGWVGGWASASGVGKCDLDDCAMVDYPYPDEPDKKRGETETCKIGGATYYRYTECKAGFVLKGSVCARKCEITKCEKIPFEHTYPLSSGTVNINDWSCKIDSKCVVGDIATYNNKEVGVIFSVTDEQVLLAPVNYSVTFKAWANSADESPVTNVPQVIDKDATTWGKIQTAGMLLFGEQKGYLYPAAKYCAQEYSPCEAGSFCGVGEWYLPSQEELNLLLDIKYIVANSMSNKLLADSGYSGVYYSSSEVSDVYIYCLREGAKYGWFTKRYPNKIIPYLSFKKK